MRCRVGYTVHRMLAERKSTLKHHDDAPLARTTRGAGAQINHRTRVGAERRARMRLRILEAAVQVFAEKGGDLPVIDDFIRAADVSRGTFYNYFRTTAELLEATVAWLADDVIRSIDPEVAAIRDPALRLATAVRMYLRWAAADPEWCRFMAKIPRIHRGAAHQAGFAPGPPQWRISIRQPVGGTRPHRWRIAAGDPPHGRGDPLARAER